jgi:hypothetical protein
MTNIIIGGDSIVASFNSWATGYCTAKGYTQLQPASVNTGTINSPSISGSTFMDYPGALGMLPNFTSRVGQYITVPGIIFALLNGVNDFYGMAANTPLGTGLPAFFADWRAGWGSLNTKLNALGANKPTRTYIFGLPFIGGSGIVRSQMNVDMRGDWMTARALMDRITAQACIEYGWTYVSLRGQTPDTLFDTRHPTLAGQNYYLSQWLAAG